MIVLKGLWTSLMQKNRAGFSLIELLVALAVIGILTIIAIPGFFRYLQMNNLSQNAQKLYYTLQYAKSEAIKRNATIYVVFQTGSNWCYGANVNATCSCNTANSCGLGAVTASNADFASLSLSNMPSNQFTFEGTRGATYLSNGLITFTLSGGTTTISLKVSALGNLLICSSTVGGYPTCT